MIRKILFLFVLYSAFACSDPFSVDRHDLIDPRIVGVRLVEGVYEVQVWNGLSVYHEVTPTVDWLSDGGEVLCVGVRCTPNEQTPRLVRYIDPNGTVHEAMFELQQTEFFLESAWSSLPEDMELDLEIREQAEGIPVETGFGTDAMRISMVTGDINPHDSSVSKMRWMTARGAGTFLELSAFETDFFRADIVMDRNEVVSNESQDHGHATVFGLYIDGSGHNQWTWMDVWYENRPIFSHQNRWLAISEEPTDLTMGGIVLTTLSWDATQRDWILTEPEVTTEIPVAPECMGSERVPFDWSTLELGICTIEDVDGVRIALETQ